MRATMHPMNTQTTPEVHPLISAQSERLMREVRALLSFARDCELSGAIETADAFGARAANKLAAAIRLQQLAAA